MKRWVGFLPNNSINVDFNHNNPTLPITTDRMQPLPLSMIYNLNSNPPSSCMISKDFESI